MDYEFIKSLKLVDRYITSLTSARIQAIHKRGEVPDRFSLEHLQSLHAEIFQDLPAAFFAEEAQPFFEAVPSYYLDHNPSEFRQPSDPFNPHSKYRAYGLEDTVCTFYSCVGEQDLQQAEAYLAGLDVAALKAAPYEAKVAAVAEMYQTLEFLHPFPEGNSRTLRVFTQQFASSIDLEFD